MRSFGFSGRGNQPGGEAEQRQAHVAQEAAAPEPDLRELLLVETLLEIHQVPNVFGHTRLPPLDRSFFRGLYEASRFRRSVSGFHEPDKVGGSLVQVGFSGDRAAFDFQGERRALDLEGLGQAGRFGI
jgi:hypothetical protein